MNLRSEVPEIRFRGFCCFAITLMAFDTLEARHLEAGRVKRAMDASSQVAGEVMLKDRENILNALREKPLKAYQVMRRANLPNEEACQSLLLKMRDEGLVKF